MTQVVVAEPVIQQDAERTVVRVEVTVPASAPRTVEYVLPPVAVDRQQVIDAMFVIGRTVAMKAGWRLVLPGPVSRLLLDRAEIMQDLWLEWFPRLASAIPLDFEAAEPLTMPAGRGVLSTFSGGVDSYFTALETQEDLSGLLFVHGLDIGLENTEFRERVRSELVTAASDLDLPLWEVETNVRQLTNPYAAWGVKAHGAVLASVAILLAQRVHTFLLPGTFPRGATQGKGWGSHILLDKLNSTDYLSVVHHGADTSRPEKTARIAQSETALRHLRVCYSSDTDYNCGRCAKCRRTQIDLDLAGVDDLSGIFADLVPIDVALAEFEVPAMAARIFAESTVEVARSLGRQDVVVPVREAIRRYQGADVKARAIKLKTVLRKDPELRKVFRPKPRKPRRTPASPPPPPPTLRAVVAHRLPDTVAGPLRRARSLKTRSAPPRARDTTADTPSS